MVFAILTNIVTFLPMLFVPGVMGQLWRNIPLIIVAVFSISMVEALFILPSHLAHQRPRVEGPVWRLLEYPQRRFSRGLERFIERRYRPFLAGSLNYRYLIAAVGIAVLALSVGFVRGRLRFYFFPNVESDTVRASAALPYGVPVAETEAVMRRLLGAARDVLSEHGGDAITRGALSQVGGGDGGLGGHLATVTVFLVPSDQRPLSAEAFTRLWRQRTGNVPGLESLSFRFTIGPSRSRPVDIEISHPDPATAESLAARLAGELTRIEGVVEVDDGVAHGKPQWAFRLKPAARSLGLTGADLARQVRHAFYGAEVRRQQRGRDEVKILVRLPEEERRSEYDVEQLVLRTPAGGDLPLGQAASIERTRAYDVIERGDARRILHVTADVVPGVTSGGEVLGALDDGLLADLRRRYPDAGFVFGGQRRDMIEAMAGLGRGFGLALFIIFAMIAVPFRSYAQALVVMLAIPFGIVGAVAGHLIMGYEMSFVSMMGVVALCGVVVNDNLILIDTANGMMREGHTLREVMVLAPARRLRPILLTSLTTFFGLAPIIFERSVQAKFLIPMAISLGFGIVFSTAIALLLVPSIMIIIDDARRGIAGLRAFLRPPRPGAPAA